jgi:hypothetical protein
MRVTDGSWPSGLGRRRVARVGASRQGWWEPASPSPSPLSVFSSLASFATCFV